MALLYVLGRLDGPLAVQVGTVDELLTDRQVELVGAVPTEATDGITLESLSIVAGDPFDDRLSPVLFVLEADLSTAHQS